MICPKCGRDIPDGTVCPCSLEGPPLSDNPALNALKTVGSSPLFLALAALMSAWALLTIFSSLGVSDAILISPVNRILLKEPLLELAKKKTPVLMFESGISGENDILLF